MILAKVNEAAQWLLVMLLTGQVTHLQFIFFPHEKTFWYIKTRFDVLSTAFCMNYTCRIILGGFILLKDKFLVSIMYLHLKFLFSSQKDKRCYTVRVLQKLTGWTIHSLRMLIKRYQFYIFQWMQLSSLILWIR